MGWNPDPKIADIRDFANRHDFDQVVVVATNLKDGAIVSMTYGKTKELCNATKPLGDIAYSAILKELER